MSQYFGTTESWTAYEVMIDRNSKQHKGFSDLAMDTSLFPYRGQWPIDTPLPTLDEIAEAREAFPDTFTNCGSRQTVRVGPYFVKYGLDSEVFQVQFLP